MKRKKRPEGRLVPAIVVARELGLSVWTIRRWLENGEMRGVCKRGRWYASRRAFRALITTLDAV